MLSSTEMFLTTWFIERRVSESSSCGRELNALVWDFLVGGLPQLTRDWHLRIVPAIPNFPHAVVVGWTSRFCGTGTSLYRSNFRHRCNRGYKKWPRIIIRRLSQKSSGFNEIGSVTAISGVPDTEIWRWKTLSYFISALTEIDICWHK